MKPLPTRQSITIRAFIIFTVLCAVADIIYHLTAPNPEDLWVVEAALYTSMVTIIVFLIAIFHGEPKFYEEYVVYKGEKYPYSVFKYVLAEEVDATDTDPPVSGIAHSLVAYVDGHKVEVPVTLTKKSIRRLKGLDESLVRQLLRLPPLEVPTPPAQTSRPAHES